MSNVYSGFLQSSQMRTNGSAPLSSKNYCRSMRTNLMGWAAVKTQVFFTSATFVAKPRSCTKQTELAGMTDVTSVCATGIPLSPQTLSQALFNQCKHLSLFLLCILTASNMLKVPRSP